jgi:threonine dehydratase
MITFPDEVQAAYSRSKNIIRKTPLDHSPSLSNIIDGDVYLKLDNIQKTGTIILPLMPKIFMLSETAAP